MIVEPYKITLAVTGTSLARKGRAKSTEQLYVYTPAMSKPSKEGDWELYYQNVVGILNGYYNTRYMCTPENSWGNLILKNKGEVWMSSSPMELESMAYFIDLSKEYEDIVIFGLGIGIAFCNVLVKHTEPGSKIKSITVVEKDPDIIKIFNESIGSSITWPKRTELEIDIIQGDAFNLTAEVTGLLIDKLFSSKSLLYADIWKTLGGENTYDDMKKLCAIYSPKNVMWWGQEYELLYAQITLDKNQKPDMDLKAPSKVRLFGRALRELSKELDAKIITYGTIKEEYDKVLSVGMAAVNDLHSTIGQVGNVLVEKR